MTDKEIAFLFYGIVLASILAVMGNLWAYFLMKAVDDPTILQDKAFQIWLVSTTFLFFAIVILSMLVVIRYLKKAETYTHTHT
jgi:hypothetical protein